MKSFSLKAKLAFLLVLTTTVIIVLFSLFVRKVTLDNYESLSTDFLNSTDQLLIYALQDNMESTHQKKPTQVLGVLSRSNKISSTRFVTREGIINYSLVPSETNLELAEVEINFSKTDFTKIKSRQTLFVSDYSFDVIRPIYNSGFCSKCHTQPGVISHLTYRVDFGKARLEAANSMHKIIIAGIFAVLVLAFLIFYFLNKFVARPLKEIENAMDQIQDGKLGQKFKVETDDEIGSLKSHFNNMSEELYLSRSRIQELHFNELRQIDKLVTLGELTSGLAHEINNYSGIMLSRLEFLKEETESGALPKDYVEDIDSIEGQLMKMSLVTKNILRHAKTKKNIKQQVNLVDQVHNSFEMLKPLFKKRKISTSIVASDNNIFVNADPIQLEQVFVNLASNAIDAINYDGKINIQIGRDDKNTFLSFEDSGSGIEVSKIENIFHPFFTTKPEGKGSGLGLYIIKNILKQNNADISVLRTNTKGTVFLIEFFEELISDD